MKEITSIGKKIDIISRHFDKDAFVNLPNYIKVAKSCYIVVKFDNEEVLIPTTEQAPKSTLIVMKEEEVFDITEDNFIKYWLNKSNALSLLNVGLLYRNMSWYGWTYTLQQGQEMIRLLTAEETSFVNLLLQRKIDHYIKRLKKYYNSHKSEISCFSIEHLRPKN